MTDLTRYIPLFDKYNIPVDSRNEETVNLMMTLFFLDVLKDKGWIKGGPESPLTEEGYLFSLDMIDKNYIVDEIGIKTVLRGINTDEANVDGLAILVDKMQRLGPDGMDAAYAQMKKIRSN